LRRHLASGRRFKTGKIHQQLAAFRAFGDTASAKNHVADHRRIGQTQHHHVGVFA